MAADARPNLTRWNISAAHDPSALDCYRDGLAGWYQATDFDEATLPRFFTDNVVCQFGDYVIGRGRSIGQTLIRGPNEIRRSGLDGVVLLLDLGGMNGDIDGVSVSGRPRTIHVRHLARPSAARVDTVDAITIAIPRSSAPAWLLEPRFHGASIGDRPAVGRVLVNHLTALAAAAPGMTLHEGVSSIGAALTLAEKAFLNTGRLVPDQTRALYAGIRSSATALIDRHLTDPDLGVRTMTGALGVSRATLFRAFVEDGGIHVHIRRRRLEMARNALLGRAGRRPSVAEIAHAHGFASESHFSRVFRATYGQAPGAVGPGPGGQSPGRSADMRYDLVLGWIKGGSATG